MDPLDGSSNIDVNIPVGSIFSFFKKNKSSISKDCFLRKGEEQAFLLHILFTEQQRCL